MQPAEASSCAQRAVLLMQETTAAAGPRVALTLGEILNAKEDNKLG